MGNWDDEVPRRTRWGIKVKNGTSKSGFMRIALIGFSSVLLLSACQTTTGPQAASAPSASTVIENSEQTTINNTEVRTVVVSSKPQPETLSVLKITDGSGCPDRDPATYGVFLRSKPSDGALLCYYD